MENCSHPNLGSLDFYDINDLRGDKNIFDEYFSGEKADLEGILSTEGSKVRIEACAQVATNNKKSDLNTEKETDNYNMNTQHYNPVQAWGYYNSSVCFDIYPPVTTEGQTDNKPANSSIYIDCNPVTATGYTNCSLVDDIVSPENARDMVSPCNSFASSHFGRAGSGMDSPSSSLASSHVDKNEVENDEQMRLKRRRNNESSRLSRQKRRKLELELQKESVEVKQTNAELSEEITRLREENAEVKKTNADLSEKITKLQNTMNEWKELARAIARLYIQRNDKENDKENQNTDNLQRMM